MTNKIGNCIAAHEPTFYTDKEYPITPNSWVGINGSRMTEVTLAPLERSKRRWASADGRLGPSGRAGGLVCS